MSPHPAPLLARLQQLSLAKKALLLGGVAVLALVLGWPEAEKAPVTVPQTVSAEGGYRVTSREITDWKAVYGRVEAKDTLPARARIGGTLAVLEVSEGDEVQAGQVLGRIMDEKLAFQLGAITAQLAALESQRANAQAELARGEDLLKRGVATAQRVDALRTALSVIEGQISSAKAQADGARQTAEEGAVLAPIAGRVLQVPVRAGSVVMAGEAVVTLGGGGVFLRLSVPERYAATLVSGAQIAIETGAEAQVGRLVKLYPQIVNGRVTADVEVAGLAAPYIDARILVRLPIGTRNAVMIPRDLVATRAGLDFVRALDLGAVSERAVVLGGGQGALVEVVSGLGGGEILLPQALKKPESELGVEGAVPEALGAAMSVPAREAEVTP